MKALFKKSKLDWKPEFEKRLRAEIAENFSNDVKQTVRRSWKKKSDLIPILERIKADFESRFPEFTFAYEIVCEDIIMKITKRLCPSLQAFVDNCMDTNLPASKKS